MYPASGFPKPKASEADNDWTAYYVAVGVSACTLAAAGIIWHRYWQTST